MTLPPGGTPPPIDDETLSAWVDGTLSDAEREAVTAAMARDPALAERARDLRATVALLHALPRPVPRRTFILTPVMAAPARPARLAWFVRLFPAVTAVSAVAAILCLALFLGDLRTSGFRTARHTPTAASRAAPEIVSTNTAVASAPTPITATAAAGSAVSAPAPAATTAAGSAGSVSSAQNAPGAPSTAALPAPTATNRPAVAAAQATVAPTTAAPPAPTAPLAATATAPPLPTAVAAAGATDVAASNTAASNSAVANATTERRVPLALVRAGEIALLALFLIALAFAVAGWRARQRRA